MSNEALSMFGIVHWVNNQKPSVYSVPEEFYDAYPDFSKAIFLQVSSNQRMKIGDVRKITRTVGDVTHHIQLIKRDAVFPFPDVQEIETISIGIVTHPDNSRYDLYFDFPRGTELRRHFRGALIAREALDDEHRIRHYDHLLELARDLCMGRRDFSPVLPKPTNLINERMLLCLPKNASVNPPHPQI
ncbi:MAG: hypothetical protein WAU54_11315 [Chania sp.]